MYGNLICMPDVTATEAARRFAAILDGVEQRGEHYRIVRRGEVIAQLGPVDRGRGDRAKAVLRSQDVDREWRDELAETRKLLTVEERP